MSPSRAEPAAIAGIGCSRFGRGLPESQLALAAAAFKAALEDSGIAREEVDGLSIHLGSPFGLDYDRVAEAFDLDIVYVNQSWLHGRFISHSLQSAALAVTNGLARSVACLTAISFTRERQILAGPGDSEGGREEGGTHGESPPYGLTSPAAGAALAMQRYMALTGATSRQLGAVPVALRNAACRNPGAIMRTPITLEDHQSSRLIVDPLHLLDCCLVSDGAVVALVTTAERARDLRQKPVFIAGMQGMRAGREEFIFAPRGLGINQQKGGLAPAREKDLAIYARSGIGREAVRGFYTYDAFSPLVLFALERFGFCGPGQAAAFVQGGRIEIGGELPVNTSGGLLSEAHVGGWNSIAEIVRQLRGSAGERQIAGADCLQWGTVWGDSVLFRN